jgi:hypothetical protein
VRSSVRFSLRFARLGPENPTKNTRAAGKQKLSISYLLSRHFSLLRKPKAFNAITIYKKRTYIASQNNIEISRFPLSME